MAARLAGRRAVWWAAGVFLLSRLILFGAGVWMHREGARLMGPDTFPWHYGQPAWMEAWAPWDAGWYYGIAEHGYDALPPVEGGEPVQRNYNFYPAYPLLVRMLAAPLPGRPLLAVGLILSNLFCLLSFWLLYRLCHRLFDDETARLSVLVAAVFPNSFILSSFMTESMFLCLLLGVYLCCLDRRWLIAGVLGAVLSATRVNGLAALVPAALIVLQAYPELLHGRFSRGALRAAGGLLLYPLGLLAYMGWLWHLVGTPLAAFISSEAWGRAPGFYLHHLITDLFRHSAIGRYITGISTGSLLAIHWLLRRRQFVLYATGIAVVLPALISAPPHDVFEAMPRYLLVAFPLYIGLALLMRGRPLVIATGLAALFLLNLMHLWCWVTGLGRLM